MKKSITNNDTIAFCAYLSSLLRYLPNSVSTIQACLATEAWRMMSVAVKFHWRAGEKEAARQAVVAYVDGPGKGFYSSDALGDFLNDIYRSFTGKACKEV